MTMCVRQSVRLASLTGTHVVVPPAHRHSIAFAKSRRIHLLSGGTGVMDVLTR
jgi:hypothetical protein